MNKITTRIYFLFLINLPLISYSQNNNICSYCYKDGNKCSSSSGSCNEKCKPNMLSSMCYYCEELDESKPFYIINENDKKCTAKTKAECTKIIAESNQCVASCGNNYELGSYCYSAKTANMEEVGGKKLKCSNLYYIETETDGKQLYHCLSPGVICTGEHNSYDLETNVCKTSNSCGGKKQKVIKRAGMSDIYRCSNTCEEGEYLTNNNYCIEILGEDQFYYKNEEGQKIIIDNCHEKGLYFLSGTKECQSKE